MAGRWLELCAVVVAVSADTSRPMAEAAGLRVVDVFESWKGLAHYLVCEVPQD